MLKNDVYLQYNYLTIKQKQMTKTLNTLTNIIYIGGFISLLTFTINAIINQ